MLVSGDYRACLAHFGIDSLALTMTTGMGDSSEAACLLDVHYGSGATVQFTVFGPPALLGERFDRIPPGDQDDTAEAGADIERFLQAILSRLERIDHEEKVQGISFLGNTFLLNGKTLFTVTADDEGQLAIEIHRDGDPQPAVLLASSLLDGLYDGSIVLQNPPG